MNCEETRMALQTFLDGKLSGDKSLRIRMHLANCADCASRLDTLDRIEILSVIDEEIEPSPSLLTRFRSRLEEHRHQAAKSRAGLSWSRGNMRWGWRTQLAATVSFVVLLAGGVYWDKYRADLRQHGSTISEINIAENLPLLRDMAVIQNFDLLEDFDNIQSLSELQMNGPEQ
jgi:anti-sigma factor RsiW